jgi:hypothetical protein
LKNLEKYITETNKYNELDDFFEDGTVHPELDIHSLVNDLILDPPQDQKFTVYIPSKGRPTTGCTYLQCKEFNIPYKVVVEPQDFDSYAEELGPENLLRMPLNDQGIQYARSFIKQHSTVLGEQYHWQMDDDMKYFTTRKDNKNVRTDMLSVMSIVEFVTLQFLNVGIAGITSNAFAFSKPRSAQANRLAYGVVLIKNSIDNMWRKDTVEDWDYTLNMLEDGYCTLAFNHVNFVTPATGSNAGGNQMTDWATQEKRKDFYTHFASLWPEYFECRKIQNDKTSKGYKLHHKSRFFQNYKQELILKKF